MPDERELRQMCRLLKTEDITACKVVDSAMFSAYTTLPEGSPRRVFVQDFAAALNRRKLLANEDVDEFVTRGQNYMREE